MITRRTEQLHQIINYVRRTAGCSRQDICRELELSASITSPLVRSLLDKQVLDEVGAETSEGGRPRVKLELNPKYAVGIGIHVPMHGMKGGLVDARGNCIAERCPEVSTKNCIEDTLNDIYTMIAYFQAEVGSRKLCGVGISVSGVIGNNGTVTREFSDGEPWINVPLADAVEERCGIRPIVLNDVHAATLAEYRLGGWGGIRNLVLLHVGDGIAAGYIINGSLYRGARGNAGQIGHNMVDETGPLCYCGNRGCLESLASPQALARDSIDAIKRGVRTRILEEAGAPEAIRFKHIRNAAAGGDPFAANLLDTVGRTIGQTVAKMINTFEPEMFLLGGLLTDPESDIVANIRRSAELRMLPALRQNVAIDCGRLKGEAATLGAGVAVLDTFFSDVNQWMDV